MSYSQQMEREIARATAAQINFETDPKARQRPEKMEKKKDAVLDTFRRQSLNFTEEHLEFHLQPKAEERPKSRSGSRRVTPTASSTEATVAAPASDATQSLDNGAVPSSKAPAPAYRGPSAASST